MIGATQRIALGYLDTFSLALHQFGLLDDEEVRSSLARQIYFTGVRALPLISLFALLFGAVVVTSALTSLGADNELALKAVVWGGLRELAPLAAAMIIVARSSVAIGAELSLMRMRSGIHDSVWNNAVQEAHPVLPRVLGLALSATMLVAYFQCIAFLSAILAASFTLRTPLATELANFLDAAQWWHIPFTLIKGTVFGAGIGVISCYHGLCVNADVRDVPKAVMAACIGSLTWVCAVEIFAVLLFLA
jgi:phospholipid/cholesterol/gamma-HCH transport system permease protein